MTFAATILTLYPEMFSEPNFGYSRPDVFELNVDTRAKDGVKWSL